MARLVAVRGLQSARGLADVLESRVGGADSVLSSAREPWTVSRLRAFSNSQPQQQSSTSSGGDGTAAAAAALEAPGTETSTSGRPPLPPGTADFSVRQLLMLYTCRVCETRSAKAFSKQSYERGVVIVECPGCSSRHLIADHLGWFGSKGTVEDFAAEKGGMVVRKLADGTVELTPEEVLGTSGKAADAAASLADGGPQ